jgi:hypothetical protein
LIPPPRLRLSEWIEQNIRLPEGVSALPGPVRLWPYQVGVADAISDPSIERVSVLKAARVSACHVPRLTYRTKAATEAMMRMSKNMISAALLLWVTFIHPAAAESSGNDVIEDCNAPEGSAKWSFCFGYILGNLDQIIVLQRARVLPNKYCPPSGITQDQMFAVWRRYWSMHPDQRHMAAPALIFLMMSEAFPCR